ncbi:hypothetical protein [Actinophytocola gossypii]|uniref:ABC transporter permease n=1 Tax=Actinophytocola gossypii TaxID=2812003 RepID=A0ABT2JF85_9PSEU|nr:hypothetical protein [Actinophytocola gossypii]MCT2586376.1 hypothetical protein [Actinophytocola gossypii]
MTTRIAKRWPTLRVMLAAHLPFVAVLWVLFTVVVLIIAGVVGVTNGMPDSVVHDAATQVPRWLLFGLGLDLVNTYLRLQLAHGRTRREFFGQAVTHTVLVSGFAALLVTLCYLVERALYAILDWPQTLDRTGLFTAADQYPVIFGTYWLTLLLWTVAGVLIGLGFFRSAGHGLLTIPLGLVVVLPSLVVVGNSGMPFIGDDLAVVGLSNATVLGVSCGLFVLAVGLAWAMVRHVPMKPQAV